MSGTKTEPDLFQRALAAQAQGRWDEAVDLCGAILASSPREVDAWHLLGFAQAGRGRHLEALDAYDRALSLKPSDPMTHYNRGVSLQALQRWPDAVASYDLALAVRPAFPEALNNRGNALRTQRKLLDALASFEAALALRPDYFEAVTNRAMALQELGRFEEAIAAYDLVIALVPDHADAHHQRGHALHQIERFDAALASYDAALALRPRSADALNDRSITLRELKRPADALASCEAALAIHPRHFEALSNRGLALLALWRPQEALESFAAALALRPDHPGALNNRANVLQQLNRFDEALQSYNAALSIRPAYVEALTNRGNALQHLRRLDEALANYAAALSLRSDYAEAHFAQSLCRLRMGDFERGWQGYEWRWETALQRGSKRDFSQPMWDAQHDIADRTILIHAEQGHGDTIQFCRYVPVVADRGAKVVLEVQSALKRMLQGLPGVQSIAARGDPLPHFDCHCPLLSLPRVFATTLATIPSPPQLRLPEQLVQTWRTRLPLRQGMRIGIVWAGAAGFSDDRNRSVGLKPMLTLKSLPIELVALQKELSDEDAAALAADDIMHFGRELTDFLETASLAVLMDVVISVDTSVAHLAATLGIETWLLLPFAADWRWLLDRDDSPWYASVRIFRQPTAGDWPSVMAAVRAELKARVAPG